MKMSRRAKRMQKHHKRKGMASLNITSLMDIFTLMVFFLLFNSTGVDIQTGTQIKLPQARASKAPQEMVVIAVDKDKISVQGRPVASVTEVLAGNELVIPELKSELEFQRGSAPSKPGEQQQVTIVGDRQLPYRLVKRLMVTCSVANYGNISLAVQHKSGQKG